MTVLKAASRMLRGAAFVKSGSFFIEWPSEDFRCKPDYEVTHMLSITKFGGSSLSCAARWRQVREIVCSDIARRVVVVSAAGKRHADDHKITDLLYLCHAHLRYGVPCWDLWRRIAERYLAIRDECAIDYPIEQDLEAIYSGLSAQTSADFLASRGEYLSAKLMAAYLGFSFVDAANWLQFDYTGAVLQEASYAALQSLADGRKIVTPGFYGAMPDGRIHTFSRGGSDITGSLAAAALHADVYENWTDVPGILAADPKIVKNPLPIPNLSYPELQLLSSAGTQVLHESAVEPVRARQIPLQIRSTFQPELPGTRIGSGVAPDTAHTDVVGFAGRRPVSMLRITAPTRLSEETLCSVLSCLSARSIRVFHSTCGAEGICLLLRAGAKPEALHAAADALRAMLPDAQVKLRENLALLLALCRTTQICPRLAAAIEAAGVPVHHLIQMPPALLLCVNDSQYETALRAAYAAQKC